MCTCTFWASPINVNTELLHLKLLAAGELGHLAAQRGGGGGAGGGAGRGGGLLAGEGRPGLGLHGGGLRVEAGGHLLLLGAGVSPPSLDTLYHAASQPLQ